MRNNAEYITSLFEVYFDGTYGVDPQPNTSGTHAMGVCKLEFSDELNELTVHLRRPGLLIGKAGIIINALEAHLGVKVKIEEVRKLYNPEPKDIEMEFDDVMRRKSRQGFLTGVVIPFIAIAVCIGLLIYQFANK